MASLGQAVQKAFVQRRPTVTFRLLLHVATTANELTMILKNNAGRTYLYRSRWVPKGPGVPHGYSTQTYVGVIGQGVERLPPEVATLLTPDERRQLEDRLLAPRRRSREEAERREAERAAEPGWRLEQALELIREAGERSERSPVDAALTSRLTDALRTVRTRGQYSTGQATATHPLVPALRAIRAAAQAVRSGELGCAPEKAVRNTKTYQLWSDLYDATCGETSSLLRALQQAGFVKSRHS